MSSIGSTGSSSPPQHNPEGICLPKHKVPPLSLSQIQKRNRSTSSLSDSPNNRVSPRFLSHSGNSSPSSSFSGSFSNQSSPRFISTKGKPVSPKAYLSSSSNPSSPRARRFSTPPGLIPSSPRRPFQSSPRSPSRNPPSSARLSSSTSSPRSPRSHSARSPRYDHPFGVYSVPSPRLNHPNLPDSPKYPEDATQTIFVSCKVSFKDIEKNKKLESLILTDCHIISFPKKTSFSETLVNLTMTKMKLKFVPKFISQCLNLTILNLRDNYIEDASIIFKLKALRILNLAFNSLMWLPKEIKCANLECLDLEHNFLSTLPKWSANIEQLRCLRLDDNQLSELPDVLGQWTALRTLSIAQNQISDITSLYFLTNLEMLDLSSNQIASVDEKICNLVRLKSLDLSNNYLTYLPQKITLLDQLAIINLKNNFMESLPTGWNYSRITSFNIAENPLKHDDEVLCHLQKHGKRDNATCAFLLKNHS